jgi:hypothetical protein
MQKKKPVKAPAPKKVVTAVKTPVPAKKSVPDKKPAPVAPLPVIKCTCTTAVSSPVRTQGLLVGSDVLHGDHNLVTLKGPGVFLCAEVSKQGGSNDLTFIILDIDGKNVVNLSVAAMINLGITQNNPYGLVVFQSPVLKTITIGYQVPLKYSRELSLRVTINEDNVVQIVGNVISGAV